MATDPLRGWGFALLARLRRVCIPLRGTSGRQPGMLVALALVTPFWCLCAGALWWLAHQ